MNQALTVTPLKGLTWDHPRGVDGLVATDTTLQEKFGVTIQWQSRSLLAFGDQRISEFASDFDFLVVDHPHVPDAVHDGALLPLDRWVGPEVIAQLALESVGESHNSYLYKGNCWAFAIDAAAQVSLHRSKVNSAPTYWSDVLRDSRLGRVLWPYKPVDAFSTFATMMAQLGSPMFGDKEEVINEDAAYEVFETLSDLSSHIPENCSKMNPVDVAEILSTQDDFDYSPALYGYTNYSRSGFRTNRLQYDDVVSFDGRAGGSQLGGAGIAVSATTNHPELASQVAAYLSMGACQSSSYTTGGGQPANLRAWVSPELNELTNNFFRYTLRTLERAWVRPRILGYPEYQMAFSLLLHDSLVTQRKTTKAIAELVSIPSAHLLGE